MGTPPLLSDDCTFRVACYRTMLISVRRSSGEPPRVREQNVVRKSAQTRCAWSLCTNAFDLHRIKTENTVRIGAAARKWRLASCLVLKFRASGGPSGAAIGRPQRWTDSIPGAGDRRGRNASALHPLYLPRTPSGTPPSALVRGGRNRRLRVRRGVDDVGGQKHLAAAPAELGGIGRPRRLPQPRRLCPFHLVSKGREFSAPPSCQAR